MDFDYFPVNPFGPWSVEVDQGQPWGSTSEGWERRCETGEPGLHSDTESRIKQVFLLFMVNRDAIPPWPQHSEAAQLPTFGESTGISTDRGQGRGFTLVKGGKGEKTPAWF